MNRINPINQVSAQTIQSDVNSFVSLPDELFQYIFEIINDVRPLQQVTSTCKSWNIKCITSVRNEKLGKISAFINWITEENKENPNPLFKNLKDDLLGVVNKFNIHNSPGLRLIRRASFEIREKFLEVLENSKYPLENLKLMPKTERLPFFFDPISDLAQIYIKQSTSTLEQEYRSNIFELEKWHCFDKALKFNDKLTDFHKISTLTSIFYLLVKGLYFDKANDLIDPILSCKEDHYLGTLCEELMKEKLFDKAVSVLRRINIDSCKTSAIGRIVKGFETSPKSITEHHRKEILICLNTIENEGEKDPAFFNYAMLLLLSELFDEAIAVTVKKTINKLHVIYWACDELQKKGDLDKAIKFSNLTNPKELSSKELNGKYKMLYPNLSKALAIDERYEEALTIAAKTPDENVKKIACHYVYHLQAINEAKSMSSGQEKWTALLNLARDLAIDEYTAMAIEVANIIEDDKFKSLALQAIYYELKTKFGITRTPHNNYDDKKSQEMFNLADSIPDDQIKSYTLRDYCKYTFRWEHSNVIAIAKTIPDAKIRDRTLLELS